MVTGGTGFVGRHVVRALLDSGTRTSVLCRPGSAGKEIDPRVHAVHTTPDLFAEPSTHLAELLQGIDTIVHCAWCTDHADYSSAPQNIECLEGTIRLARIFAHLGGKRFVGLGTCAEYEPSHEPLSSFAPLRPTNLYASCKTATFLVLENYFATTATSFVWCRLFYLYGEGEHPQRLTPTVRRNLENGIPISLTEGTQIRDFLDVCEAGTMLAACAQADCTGAVNICSGSGISIREYVERLADQYGRHDLLQFGLRPANTFDPPIVIGIRDDSLFKR